MFYLQYLFANFNIIIIYISNTTIYIYIMTSYNSNLLAIFRPDNESTFIFFVSVSNSFIPFIFRPLKLIRNDSRTKLTIIAIFLCCSKNFLLEAAIYLESVFLATSSSIKAFISASKSTALKKLFNIKCLKNYELYKSIYLNCLSLYLETNAIISLLYVLRKSLNSFLVCCMISTASSLPFLYEKIAVTKS